MQIVNFNQGGARGCVFAGDDGGVRPGRQSGEDGGLGGVVRRDAGLFDHGSLLILPVVVRDYQFAIAIA